MSIDEESAEAVVARRPGNAGGAKGRRDPITTDRLRSEASSHPKHEGVATAAASRRREEEALGGFPSVVESLEDE